MPCCVAATTCAKQELPPKLLDCTYPTSIFVLGYAGNPRWQRPVWAARRLSEEAPLHGKRFTITSIDITRRGSIRSKTQGCGSFSASRRQSISSFRRAIAPSRCPPRDGWPRTTALASRERRANVSSFQNARLPSETISHRGARAPLGTRPLRHTEKTLCAAVSSNACLAHRPFESRRGAFEPVTAHSTAIADCSDNLGFSVFDAISRVSQKPFGLSCLSAGEGVSRSWIRLTTIAARR